MTLLLSSTLISGCTSQPITDITTQTESTQEQTTTQTTATQNLPTYTLTDIAKHNSADSCWTVIKGNVYDLTEFITQHPGGERGILKTCGKDGTQDFLGAHSR
jgi:cytochrome b involved in lipid metabolism